MAGQGKNTCPTSQLYVSVVLNESLAGVGLRGRRREASTADWHGDAY
jgi:hypothetical protein